MRTTSCVEVGPGLGSLTLALLPEVAAVTAVEVDPVLAGALPRTVARFRPEHADRLRVVLADAMQVTRLPGPQPTALVANLPYNVSVPVVLCFLERFPTLRRVLVMVQLEVAERLAAPPGSRTYGVPSVKAAWYADVRLAGSVRAVVFWPVPNVDSGLVRLTRREPPAPRPPRRRLRLRRRGVRPAPQDLRAALAAWAGARPAEQALGPPGSTRTRGGSSSTSRRSPRSRGPAPSAPAIAVARVGGAAALPAR